MNHPGHAVLYRLEEGQLVDLEDSGFIVKMIPGPLRVGDTYVGARNTVNLLTVKYIEGGEVYSTDENVHPFRLSECVKVDAASC